MDPAACSRATRPTTSPRPTSKRERSRGMDARDRALTGALGGLGATLVLTGLRQAWSKIGLVFETAPMQVVDRVEELGFLGELSPGGRRLLTVAAHFAYGV